MEARIVVRLLVARVRDDDVRAVAERAHEALDLVRSANDQRAAEAAMEKALDAVQQAFEAIGRALRGLPAPTQYRPLVTTPFSPADRPSSSNGVTRLHTDASTLVTVTAPTTVSHNRL